VDVHLRLCSNVRHDVGDVWSTHLLFKFVLASDDTFLRSVFRMIQSLFLEDPNFFRNMKFLTG
jgi:hypothetical protein